MTLDRRWQRRWWCKSRGQRTKNREAQSTRMRSIGKGRSYVQQKGDFLSFPLFWEVTYTRARGRHTQEGLTPVVA
ncbi:hypothetical protein NDU88_006211 [Pleurodeles waltl]|uniref:Uncharacterized protein n=1 Tax=Pleurodeles waltl TaxID=8319 RepID=A0AAV7NR98_PLEWA|nr:hypothetical protein NDU88_006211 [Pleurodeles waltl]